MPRRRLAVLIPVVALAVALLGGAPAAALFEGTASGGGTGLMGVQQERVTVAFGATADNDPSTLDGGQGHITLHGEDWAIQAQITCVQVYGGGQDRTGSAHIEGTITRTTGNNPFPFPDGSEGLGSRLGLFATDSAENGGASVDTVTPYVGAAQVPSDVGTQCTALFPLNVGQLLIARGEVEIRAEE